MAHLVEKPSVILVVLMPFLSACDTSDSETVLEKVLSTSNSFIVSSTDNRLTELNRENISILWGSHGELWQPDSRLPFVALAGYKEGKEPIPSKLQVVANVADFGATSAPNSELDTQAFMSAIEYASSKVSAEKPGIIYIPAGEYNIDEQLHLSKSGLVLVGESRESVILRFTTGLIDSKTALGADPKRRKLVVLGGGIDEKGKLRSGLAWQQWNRNYSAAVEAISKRGDYFIRLSSELNDIFLDNLKKQGNRLRLAQWMNYGEYSQTPQLAENLYGGPEFSAPGSKGGIWVSQQFNVRVDEDNQTLILDRPLRFTPTTESEYGGARVSLRDDTVSWETQVIGIERMTIELPATDWLDHYGTEGQGGIDILSDNSWVKDIKLINADNGIETNKATFNNTISNVVLSGNRIPRRSGPSDFRYDAYGHHGLTLTGRDHLLSGFELEVSFVHDVTMNNCHGCVVTKGKGQQLNMDHHRQGIYSSIWTELNLGSPHRMWDSTGNPSEGFNSAAFNTYWNIVSEKPELAYWPEDGDNYPQWGYHKINIVGTDIKKVPEEGNRPYPFSPLNTHLEVIAPSKLRPVNIYHAQVEAFRAGKLKGMESPILNY